MNRRSVSDLLPAAVRILSLLALAILGSGPVNASPRGEESRLSSSVAAALAGLVREKSQALVRIHCRDDAGEVIGTGFLVDPAGTVCTLTDFVRGGGLLVEADGKSQPATLIAADERTGIAFLRIAAATPAFIQPFPSAGLPAVSPIAAIRTASGGENAPPTPLLGVAVGKIDRVGERFFPVPLIKAMLPAPGSRPGTPVFDLSGKFAGLVVLPRLDDDSSAILPASAVEKLHGDLIRFGRPNPGWIGAIVEEAAVPEGTSRTRVDAVEPGSPAERAGILPGDYVLSIGNRTIVKPQEVLEASFYLAAGDQVRLLLSRNGRMRQLALRCIPVPGSPFLTRQ